jgi:hypothetical protein
MRAKRPAMAALFQFTPAIDIAASKFGVDDKLELRSRFACDESHKNCDWYRATAEPAPKLVDVRYWDKNGHRLSEALASCRYRNASKFNNVHSNVRTASRLASVTA